jgi:hypothetical protein
MATTRSKGESDIHTLLFISLQLYDGRTSNVLEYDMAATAAAAIPPLFVFDFLFASLDSLL